MNSKPDLTNGSDPTPGPIKINTEDPAVFTIAAGGSFAAICARPDLRGGVGLRLWPEGVETAGPPDLELKFDDLESMVRFFAIELQAATEIYKRLFGVDLAADRSPNNARRKGN